MKSAINKIEQKKSLFGENRIDMLKTEVTKTEVTKNSIELENLIRVLFITFFLMKT